MVICVALECMTMSVASQPTRLTNSTGVGSDFPSLATRLVPVGALAFWGHALEWPAWMWHGTRMSAQATAEDRISLIDDFIVTRNLLENVGGRKLLEILLTFRRIPCTARFALQLFSAPTIRDAVNHCVEANKVGYPDCIYATDEGPDNLSISVSVHGSNRDVDHFRNLVLLFYLARIVHFLQVDSARDEDGPESLSIFADDDGCIIDSSIRSLSNCEIRLGCSEYRIEIPNSRLDVRNPSSDPPTWAMALIDGRGGRSPDTGKSFALRVRSGVVGSLARHGRPPHTEEMAKSMGLSARSLARHLAQEGLSYGQIVATCRMEIAQELLLSKDISVTDMSRQLGYTESSSFVRAFRAQFGLPPSEWRHKYRGQPATSSLPL